MRWLNGIIGVIGSVVPAVLLGIVLVVVTANVVARTILEVPFYVAHDVALIAFAGVVWFGIVGAAATGQMFGVSFFVGLLPARLGVAAAVLQHLIVIAIAGAVIHAAWAQIESARFTTFLALGWPKWIVSAGLLAAMAVIVVIQLVALVRLFLSPPARS
jgi:TRAP-type C4-dicarboxylate transport system permease small subunit